MSSIICVDLQSYSTYLRCIIRCIISVVTEINLTLVNGVGTIQGICTSERMSSDKNLYDTLDRTSRLGSSMNGDCLIN